MMEVITQANGGGEVSLNTDAPLISAAPHRQVNGSVSV